MIILICYNYDDNDKNDDSDENDVSVQTYEIFWIQYQYIFYLYLYDKFNLGVGREPSLLLFAKQFSHLLIWQRLPHQLLSLSALDEPLGVHPPQKQSVGQVPLMTFIRRSCSSLAIFRARARFR